MIAVSSVSKFEEIQNTCGVTEQKINLVLSNGTVNNVGDFLIIFTGFKFDTRLSNVVGIAITLGSG